MTSNQEIEVVLKKKMTIAEYHKMMPEVKKKGWDIQGYEIGYYSEGFKNKLQ